MSSTDWKKPAIASRPVYWVGSPKVARYGSSKAPSSANISAAFFGSLNEKAVYSSISSLAFFINMSPVPGHQSSELFTGAPEPSPPKRRNRSQPVAELSALGLRGDPHGFVKRIHHKKLENGDKKRSGGFATIMLKQTDSGIQQLHRARERTEEQ